MLREHPAKNTSKNGPSYRDALQASSIDPLKSLYKNSPLSLFKVRGLGILYEMSPSPPVSPSNG
jgi:hypothetical protein